jgi:hypothetical protein
LPTARLRIEKTYEIPANEARRIAANIAKLLELLKHG